MEGKSAIPLQLCPMQRVSFQACRKHGQGWEDGPRPSDPLGELLNATSVVEVV